MNPVGPCELPSGSLLARYAGEGGYADCWCAAFPHAATQAAYVEAFYTSRLFQPERLILALAVSRPSTDAEAAELGRGERERFAAWKVEARTEEQLLLADFTGRTRSWLMARPAGDGGTTLYFGSAVVPVRDKSGGPPRLGATFSALLGFHRLYSRVLLSSARARLARTIRSPD